MPEFTINVEAELSSEDEEKYEGMKYSAQTKFIEAVEKHLSTHMDMLDGSTETIEGLEVSFTTTSVSID